VPAFTLKLSNAIAGSVGEGPAKSITNPVLLVVLSAEPMNAYGPPL